jgi:hypothetical protein
MYARYNSQDDATLSYIEDALHHFQTINDVFLLRRTFTKENVKLNALKTELVNQRKEDEETNAETWMLSMMRCKMTARGDYTSHKTDISKELDTNINFRNIHSVSDWAEQFG